MKILHISTDYTRTKLYYELISRLEKNGFENMVYVPANVNTKCEKKDNGEKYPVYFSKVYNTIDRFLFKKKEKKIYQDIITKFDFKTIDKIHAHTLFSAGYIAYLIKKKYNIPYVVSVRNTDINIFFKYRKNLKHIGIQILQEAEKVVCISEAYKNTLIQKYIPKRIKNIEKKINVISNGINSYWLENAKSKENIPNEYLNLVQTGVINSNKNLKVTIKVVKKLNKIGQKTNLYIIGEGPLFVRYKNKYANEHVIFKGQMTKEQIMEFYEKMDIFILPSKHETFGLVYAEAISQGLPVLYTENEGFDRNFPEGEIGYSINPKNIKDIIQKIMNIKENYLVISKNACNGSKKFNWDNIVDKFKMLY